jgi:uncharacterized protein
MSGSAVARTLVAGVLALTLVACGDDSGAPGDGIDLSAEDGPRSESGRVTLPEFEEVAVEVTTDGGDLLAWCLLLARLAEQRSRGLMEVTDLGDYAGMLFEFEEDSAGAFYMANTPTPLSIAFLTADGAVVSTADMEPCLDTEPVDCPLYPPDGPYRYAVEVPQGELDDLGLDGPGARLVTTGGCDPV